jgi:hypothetical protein
MTDCRNRRTVRQIPANAEKQKRPFWFLVASGCFTTLLYWKFLSRRADAPHHLWCVALPAGSILDVSESPPDIQMSKGPAAGCRVSSQSIVAHRSCTNPRQRSRLHAGLPWSAAGPATSKESPACKQPSRSRRPCRPPSAAIPIAAVIAIATVIVIWHLRRGGRALIRRSPKGTLTFVLDSKRRTSTMRGQK